MNIQRCKYPTRRKVWSHTSTTALLGTSNVASHIHSPKIPLSEEDLIKIVAFLSGSSTLDQPTHKWELLTALATRSSGITSRRELILCCSRIVCCVKGFTINRKFSGFGLRYVSSSWPTYPKEAQWCLLPWFVHGPKIQTLLRELADCD